MSIAVSIVSSLPKQAAAEVVALPFFAGQKVPTTLPKIVRTMVARRRRSVMFTGEWGTAELFALPKPSPLHFVALLGLGVGSDSPSRQAEGARRAVGKIVQEMRQELLRHLVVDLRLLPPADAVAAAVVEAAELVSYRFTDYLPKLQQEQESRALKKITIVVTASQRVVVKQAIAARQALLPGVELTRHLVNQPASSLTPATLVEIARSIKKNTPTLGLKIFDRAKAETAGFNAFLAVARGSMQEPYVIHLTYRPPQPKAKIFLVGKGITFDSGGLSLKPAEAMETMKIDMAGAAAVLGLFSVIGQLKLDVEVHGVIAACENMPSGAAYRPGDILRAMNGKTIEVMNTDAEGRLTLADALSYAVSHQPQAIVDLATLTGACMVALGETHAGLFTNNDELKNKLLAAAEVTGERLAHLPLPEEYHQLIESRVADVRNTATTRYGGAITAALFLRDFVNTTPWAHMDIAGPAYAERPLLPYYDVPGATGYGVRLLVQYLQALRA